MAKRKLVRIGYAGTDWWIVANVPGDATEEELKQLGVALAEDDYDLEIDDPQVSAVEVREDDGSPRDELREVSARRSADAPHGWHFDYTDLY